MAFKQNQKIELKPKLRFPEFRGAGEWEEKRIEDVAPLQRGFDLPSDQIKAGQVPVVYSNGVQSFHNAGMAKAPGIVTGRSGTIGKIHFIEEGEYWPHNTSLWVTDFRGNFPKFIYYLFQSIGIDRFASGSGVPTLNRNDVHAFRACLPLSATEQKRIADCLSSLDELITAEALKLDSLKAHKKGLMQQLFPAAGETVPSLRFPKFRDGGGWVTRELGEFITERDQSPKENVPLFSLTIEDGVTPKTERYERSFLVKDEEDAYKLMLPGDFAFNPMNLRFGAIARHSGTEKVAVSKYYNIFYCDKTVDSRFCHIYFTSYRMIAFYDDMAAGSLLEKRRVHFNDFLKFSIRFPPLPEQQEIADCLSSIDELITAQSQKIDALKDHKKALMLQLFPVLDEVQG